MGAAVFFQCDSRPLFDTFCLGKPVGFPSAKKWNKTQPTTGQTSYTFGMNLVDAFRALFLVSFRSRFDFRPPTEGSVKALTTEGPYGHGIP